MLSWFCRPKLTKHRISGSRARTLILRVEALEDRQLLAAPVIDPIANTSMPAGKSLLIPVTASDPEARTPVNYSVTSNNAAVTGQVLRGTFLLFEVEDFGNLIFQLFDNLTPITTATIAGYAKAGFYDNLTFHRIVSGFVVQGGDPNGNGTGGPPGPGTPDPRFQINDEFDRRLIFSGSGQLAMANSGDDTNGSQFFITLGPQRFLDFNHTIFGQLVRGKEVLDRIASVPVVEQQPGGERSRPVTPVRIRSARVITNLTDGVLLIEAGRNAGPATLIVTAENRGETSAVSFTVTPLDDSANNNRPFLGPVSDQFTPINTPVSFDLTATDLEGDPLIFDAVNVAGVNVNGAVSLSGNRVTVTPNQGFTGNIQVRVGVRDATSDLDSQLVNVAVGGAALASSGVPINTTRGQALQNVNVAGFTHGDPNATPADFTVFINWGDATITNGTITPTDTGFLVSGTHTYQRAGNFPVTTTIQHRLGNRTFARSTATVLNQPFSVQAVPVATTTETALNDVTFATFTPPSPDRGVGDFAATVDLGDGTGPAPATITLGPGGTFAVTAGNRRYTQPGTYTTQITVTDLTGSVDVGQGTTTVFGIATVTVSEAGTGPNARFVRQAFREILEREGDDPTVAAFTGKLDRGELTRGLFVQTLVTSQEYRIKQINNLYQRFLGRTPDEFGLRTWLEFLNLGFRIEWVQAGIIGSLEYFLLSGSTNAGFLNKLYRDMFDRDPDQFGRTNFTIALRGGRSRFDVAIRVLLSEEFFINRTVSLFQDLLQRDPAAEERTQFVTAYRAGTGHELLIIFIAQGDEYFNQS